MKCSFCRKELPRMGTITYVKNSGDVYHFCSSKCEKSLLMGRDYRKKKWVTSEKRKAGTKKKSESKKSQKTKNEPAKKEDTKKGKKKGKK